MPCNRDNEEFKIGAGERVREQGLRQQRGREPWRRHLLDSSMGPRVRLAAGPSVSGATAAQFQRENTQLREENRRLFLEREILTRITGLAWFGVSDSN